MDHRRIDGAGRGVEVEPVILFKSAPNRPESRSDWSDPNKIPGPLDMRSALSPGPYVARESLEVAALVACVGMRAGAFAQLPLKAYRDRDGFGEVVPSQPELMVAPSAAVVPSVWKTQMSISRDIWGYAAGYIRAVDAAGYPSKVDWLCPGSDIHAHEHVDGIDWRIDHQPVDASMIVHVPSRWVLPGRPLGICPLEYSGLVDLARRAQAFGRDWFVNGAMPSAILYSDSEISSTEADSLLARMLQRWSRRQPAVIGSGMKYEAVSVKADESQFLETMRQVSADIAISFNLPPERINAATGKGNEYANISQNQQQYLLDSINPDLVVIQEALGKHTPRGQYLRWQTGAFLRSDLKTRYESYKVGLEGEFITVDEVRAWEELPPLGDDIEGDMP
jgi:HK97 family phage portal protein